MSQTTMATLLSPNKVTRSQTFSKRRFKVNQDYLTEKLSNYYREYLIGTDPDPVTLAIFLTMDHGKIAEMVISTMFGIPLEAANNAGYDIDTTGVTLDGVDYGRIEVRARRLQSYGLYFPFITYGRDMRAKTNGSADYFFLCGWDPDQDQPVWFRVPRRVALSNTTLAINKSTRNGGWGWANDYLWSGPTTKNTKAEVKRFTSRLVSA